MMGMRTGLAPRAGRVSTEAKGRLGCAEEPEEFRITELHFQGKRCGLTGGFGLFFLMVADLEPENRLLSAAKAALALATFLLGPVPRKTCLSTSTCQDAGMALMKGHVWKKSTTTC